MDISPPHAPWEKGPRFHPVEWTQSKIDWGHKGLLASTNEQLQQMMKFSKIEGVEYTPLKEGLSHFVFKVFSADHESICIIKAASREQRNSLAGAVYWQGWLEKLIPVPQILFHDLTFDEIPYAFIVFEYMDAQDLITCVDDLSDSELDEIAVKVVEANHALLSIPSCGGFGGAKSHFDKGMFATWGEFLQSIIESTQPQLMVFPKYRLVAEQILQKLDFLKSSIDAVKPLPFLEDATHRNVLI